MSGFVRLLTVWRSEDEESGLVVGDWDSGIVVGDWDSGIVGRNWWWGTGIVRC